MLPLLALLSLALVEFGLVVRDQVLVAHAAREAARAAAVGDDAAAAAFTGTGLRDLRVVVSGGATVGTARTVTVERTEGGHLPLFGRLSAGFTLRASAAMRFEGPP